MDVFAAKFNASGIRTGALYTNNFDSPLTATGQLWYKQQLGTLNFQNSYR
jgi:hypothetical protein